MSELKQLENAKVEVTATIDGDSWKNAQTSAFNKLALKVEVKGFRKGQAPKNLVKKYISTSEVLLEAAESLAQKTLEACVDEHHLELIDRPELKLNDINEEKCELVFICPVKPNVTLSDIENIKYNVEEVTVDDKEVDDQIAELLNNKADLELKEDGEVEDGDTVVIDFEGFVDGVAFEGGKAESHELVIGSNSFIPGFETQLIGMKSEETKDINVTFPEDYFSEDLKAKPAVFKVTVHEIKKKVVPVLNDEFVKELNLENVHNVEELKNFTKENLMTRKSNQAKNKAEQDLLDQLASRCEVELPDVMVSRQQEQLLANYEQRMMQQGIQLEQFLKITNQTVEQLKDSLKDDAIKSLKINLALSELAKRNNIEVSAEDIEKEYENLSKMYGTEIDEIKKYISVEDLKDELLNQKTLDSLKK